MKERLTTAQALCQNNSYKVLQILNLSLKGVRETVHASVGKQASRVTGAKEMANNNVSLNAPPQATLFLALKGVSKEEALLTKIALSDRVTVIDFGERNGVCLFVIEDQCWDADALYEKDNPMVLIMKYVDDAFDYEFSDDTQAATWSYGVIDPVLVGAGKVQRYDCQGFLAAFAIKGDGTYSI